MTRARVHVHLSWSCISHLGRVALRVSSSPTCVVAPSPRTAFILPSRHSATRPPELRTTPGWCSRPREEPQHGMPSRTRGWSACRRDPGGSRPPARKAVLGFGRDQPERPDDRPFTAPGQEAQRLSFRSSVSRSRKRGKDARGRAVHDRVRLVHIVSGSLWVGSTFLFVGFVGPSAAEVGPSAGPVLHVAVKKRRMNDADPTMASPTCRSSPGRRDPDPTWTWPRASRWPPRSAHLASWPR
jgi:hypothetical protein